MHSLYGKPILTELEGALLRLNEPMNRSHPIEVMLWGIEEVQIFILTNPEEDRQLSEPYLIGYALVKLSKCGGMYAKALKQWNKVIPNNRKKWAIFRKHMINEYELKITEGEGTTMGQEFGVTMHTTDTNPEEDSLTEAVTKYAERATRAEANMAEMEARSEERFAMLMLQ